MRQIVFDTETTGVEVSQGNRIIEIGCVEVIDRVVTGNTYHQYINPQRDSEEGALQVHGITSEFLADKPLFATVARSFIDFVSGAQLVIHNAAFDVGFINYELSLLGAQWGRIEDYCTVLDTLEMARRLHPGQKNNLDALCKRYDISNAHRELHGALLDAEILADVYLAMTGGQVSLGFDGQGEAGGPAVSTIRRLDRNQPLRVCYASAGELLAHEERLEKIDKASSGATIWRK
ncbi:MAG: DNA polymerase III subunit epsilon [Gammaproteobacteria bacterium]|nr:DNA polymerase III subunit epsilon [Gammaproteobacteria bacterium]